MIRVISADDHPLVRGGLHHLFSSTSDIVLAAEAYDGNDLLNQLKENTFDLVLMDMVMPGCNGIELLETIKRLYPDLPIIVLSTHKEDMFALRTLKSGASGYLCKDYAGPDLIYAIRKAYRGDVYISESVAKIMHDELYHPKRNKALHEYLSKREYQIFIMVAEGFSSSDIGRELDLSVKTVSTHKSRIKDKMNFNSDADIVRYVIENKASLLK